MEVLERQLIAYSATRSHPGHKRRINEDSAFTDVARGLWVVADGMGGYAAGDVASRTVVQSLSGVGLTGSLEDCINLLKDALLQANQRLLFETTLPSGCEQIGSTVAILFFHPEENCCVCLWVGDSRIYALRGQDLFQLTRDHSVVQEMVDSGVLDESRRDTHPQSHVITRAIGICDDLEVDVVTFEPREGDLYVLCSDGLYNEVSVAEQLQGNASSLPADGARKSEQLATTLLDATLQTSARDNVTLTVVSME